MQCHLLSLGKLVTIAFLFPLFSCAADVVCKQATASGFEEISSGAGSLRSSHVKSTPLSAFEAVDDLLSRSDEAKSTRQVVRRPKRENAQWNAAIDKLAGDRCNSSVTAGRKHKIGGLFQGFYETAFIGRLVRALMPGSCQCQHPFVLSMFRVASLGIMKQGDAHAILSVHGKSQIAIRVIIRDARRRARFQRGRALR